MKSVCVIGAGASGLTAIKCCLDEELEPTCFERSDHIAGLWHFTPDPKDGQGRVMRSTIINSSKEMSSYSDFPAPKEFAVFMHNTYQDKYFNMYADKFNLKKWVEFETEVVSVRKSNDFNTSGKWEVKYRKTLSNETKEKTFDAVLVCTGHHANVKMPSFPGMEKFKGQMLHSHDYKDYHGFEDKRVVVVGIGNSGGDIAVELSRISSQVYLSTRRGSWILNRIIDDGKPYDMVYSTRFATLYRHLFPKQHKRNMRKTLNHRFNHKTYCLEPAHEPNEQNPTVNDELPNKVASGAVNVKTDIKEIKEKSVVFVDGTTVDNIDAIIFATGYIFGFPFLDESVIKVVDNRVDLYKYMYQPDLEKQTLAVIGCFQPLGAFMPISEMQCRLATRHVKGLAKLPSKQQMWEDIRAKQDEIKRFAKSTRHTIQVDYIVFMDELAEIVGCKPNIGKLLFTDPHLAWKCYFDAATPYQYRLMGPGSWSGARDAIMNQWVRTFHPLQTRPVPVMSGSQTNIGTIVAVAAVALAVVMYYVVVR